MSGQRGLNVTQRTQHTMWEKQQTSKGKIWRSFSAFNIVQTRITTLLRCLKIYVKRLRKELPNKLLLNNSRLLTVTWTTFSRLMIYPKEVCLREHKIYISLASDDTACVSSIWIFCFIDNENPTNLIRKILFQMFGVFHFAKV